MIYLFNINIRLFSENFLQNEIDLETLEMLTPQDLVELGCNLGERKRLLLVINQINSEKLTTNVGQWTCDPNNINILQFKDLRALLKHLKLDHYLSKHVNMYYFEKLQN